MENSYESVNGNGYVSSSYNGHLGPRQHHSPRLSWLDIRVFYVRISKCEIDDSTPEHLTLNHIPLDPNTLLEVNGVRASIYSDGPSTLLRRDRLDKRIEEATFVSTDNVRITGSVKFEVYDGDVPVLSGSLDKCDSNGFMDGEEFEHVSRMWNINCEMNTSGGAGFLKGSDSNSPTIEVYVAGCFMGTPIMLTKTMHLNSRRKQLRMGMLNSIPEHDATESDGESQARLALQVPESEAYKSESEGYSNMYHHHHLGGEYIEGEDGELTWFNAGVRVGVGIGLSVCLGIGIGVGVLVKTYQGTTRTFRRRFF